MFVIQFANKEAVFALVSTTTWYFIMSDEARSEPDPHTQGLIKTLGSMVIFDENKGVSDFSKYEFFCPIYIKIIKFLVI